MIANQHIKVSLLVLLLFVTWQKTHAELVAWYPLDENPGAPDGVTENIAANDALTIGFDPDPGVSLIERGHPSARSNLGRSYLLTKGGGFDLGGAAAVQPTDKFTISFWTQPLTADAFDRFFESQVGNSNGQDGLRIDTGSGDRVRVLVRDANGASNSQFNHPVTLKQDGTWYFVAFRYDSAGIDNSPFQVTLVEHTGDPVDEAAISAATAGPATINTGPMHFPHAAVGSLIGVENAGGTGGNSLHAALDELAFFDNSDGNGVLSDQQLADVYNFGPSGVELINSFATDLESVAPGTSATLSWNVTEPFDTLILDDGLGSTTDLAPLTTAGLGTLAVTPTATTTYSLRATRGTAANVSTIRILSGEAPDISTFSASAKVIQAGGSVDLSWAVTAADLLIIDPIALDVTGLNTSNLSPASTTTYILTATNSFGTSTAEVTVSVIAGPVPTHRYLAATPGNDTILWIDEVGTRNWSLTGASYDNPLFTPSANTNIGASYFTSGGITGGSAGSFQYDEFTAELWLRPSFLTADHEVIFESGGGQNGLAVLVNQENFRFLGSSANVRNLDLTVPVAGLKLDDFVQIIITNSRSTDVFGVTIRDTAGVVRTASESADVLIGGNGAGLFVWASGALGVSDNNLGGRTEIAGTSPAGLSGFLGEIAIVNIYNWLLSAAESQLTFDSVATVVEPPVMIPPVITEIVRDSNLNTLTVTWDSLAEHTYDAQFSTNLEDWFDLAGPFDASTSETTEILNLPPNQDQFFIRIRELATE